MNLTTVLFGVLPLIVFVIVDSFAGLKTGIISAIGLALAEAVYSYLYYKTIDELTIGSLALVLVFGYISYKTENSLYFKFQPVLFGVIFSVLLLVTSFMGKPILVTMMYKYQYMIPAELREKVLNPIALELMAKSNLYLGWGFLLHAGVVAYAALYLSNWWWLILRGLGVYVMMFGAMMLARMSL